MRETTVGGELYLHRGDLCRFMTQNIEAITDWNPGAGETVQELADLLEAWEENGDGSCNVTP